MLRLGAVLHRGQQKHGEGTWRKETPKHHIEHALTHIYKYLDDDKTESHLDNAFCRLMMAVGTQKGPDDKIYKERIEGIK